MSIYQDYEKLIENQLDLPIESMNFKSQPDYMKILEHVSPQQGRQYLQNTINHFNTSFNQLKDHLIVLCKRIDSVGKPNKCQYTGFTETSPTNLRYIYQAILILKEYKKSKLKNIIEIGAGSGGLCFFIQNIAKLYGIKINSYIIMDLPVVERLIHRIKLFYGTDIMDREDVVNKSFLISNYALGELTVEIKQEYYTNVIWPYCLSGFIIWNTDTTPPFDEEEYKLTYRDEVPKTGKHNRIIVFEKKLKTWFKKFIV